MKDSGWSKTRRDKNTLRAHNASESFEHKLEQLDRLRERSQAMQGGTARGATHAGARSGATGARRKK